MAYHIDFDAEPAVAIVVLEGDLDGPQLIQAVQDLRAHPRYRDDIPRIWDGSRIQRLIVDLEEVQTLRDLAAQVMTTTGRAAVVAQREDDAILARLFQAYIKGRPVRVFTHLDAARAWVLEGADQSADPSAAR